MQDWKTPATRERIERTVLALKANGIEVTEAMDAPDALNKALALIPAGSEVMTMSSITVESIGLAKELNDSGHYVSVKNQLSAMDPATQGREQRKLGAAADYAVGSVHAVTESGTLVIASLTGSQLGSYTYGAGTVIWIVGAQKIVKDVDEGLKRIQEHILPLESENTRKKFGLPDTFRTFPSKVLLFNREVKPGRVKLILVNQALGF